MCTTYLSLNNKTCIDSDTLDSNLEMFGILNFKLPYTELYQICITSFFFVCVNSHVRIHAISTNPNVTAYLIYLDMNFKIIKKSDFMKYCTEEQICIDLKYIMMSQM